MKNNSTLYIVFLFVLFAVSVFGTQKIFTDPNIDDTLKNNLVNEFKNNTFNVLAFAKSLDYLTPTLDFKIGDNENKYFLINEFPPICEIHVIVTIILIVLASFFIYIFKIKKFMAILIFLLIIIAGYIIGSIILYGAYHYFSDQIGLTTEQAENIRRTYNDNLEDVHMPLLLLALLTLLGLIYYALRKTPK